MSYELLIDLHKGNARQDPGGDAQMNEIALYKEYRDYYSYGFYIAQKV